LYIDRSAPVSNTCRDGMPTLPPVSDFNTPNGAFLAPVCADDGWVFGDRWQALKAQNQVGATTAATATWMISEPSSAATREEHLVG
jgi:hypothetical protein